MGKIFLLMLLMHVIDDFVFQPICLSKLKQKRWWEEKLGNNLGMYKNDYIAALAIHSLSWSIMIHLPLFLFVNDFALIISVALNTAVHFCIDDYKANEHTINLLQDQAIHISQIFLTFGILGTIYLL